MKIRTKRSGLLLSFFVLLILKVTFTQVILARGNATSLSVSKSESVNPIEKEIEAMDAINKKLAALSFGSPTIRGILFMLLDCNGAHLRYIRCISIY